MLASAAGSLSQPPAIGLKAELGGCKAPKAQSRVDRPPTLKISVAHTLFDVVYARPRCRIDMSRNGLRCCKVAQRGAK